MNPAAPDTTDAKELVFTRQFSAPSGPLWGAWTEPYIIAQRMGPKGVDTRVDTHDFWVGGLFRFVLAGGETENVARGTFLTINPPRRLVFTWSWEEGVYADIETEIEVEFEANGERIMLPLTKRRLTSDEKTESHRQGSPNARHRRDGPPKPASRRPPRRS